MSKLQPSVTLPKAETIITGQHEHDWDIYAGSGKGQDLVCPEFSAGQADRGEKVRAWVGDMGSLQAQEFRTILQTLEFKSQNAIILIVQYFL